MVREGLLEEVKRDLKDRKLAMESRRESHSGQREQQDHKRGWNTGSRKDHRGRG